VAETSKQQNYYWRWIIQIGRQARADVRELAVGLIIALAILFLQVHNRTVQPQDFKPDAISTFWPYIAAIGLYLVYSTIRAPLILDREKTAKIDQLGSTLEQLQNPAKLVSFQFERLEFGVRMGTPVIVLRLTILNRGPAITLHGIRLRSGDGSTHRVSNNGFDKDSVGRDYVRIDSNDARTAFFEFRGSYNGQAWSLEYSDASNQNQQEVIPSSLIRSA
jgi:hypothetical protein